jgi:hypothetical protein
MKEIERLCQIHMVDLDLFKKHAKIILKNSKIQTREILRNCINPVDGKHILEEVLEKENDEKGVLGWI